MPELCGLPLAFSAVGLMRMRTFELLSLCATPPAPAFPRPRRAGSPRGPPRAAHRSEGAPSLASRPARGAPNGAHEPEATSERGV